MNRIEKLRQSPHLSVSAINDYVECSLQYRFGRVDHLEPEYISDALLFGTCIHRVLEGFHLAKKKREKIPLAYLIQQFENHWVRVNEENPHIQFKEGEDFKSLLQKGKELLTIYYRDLPQDSFRVLDTESSFSFELEGLEVPIVGVMDLVEEDEAGNIIITDFKTSSHAYSKDEIDKSFQLTIYYMAARRNGFANREILLRFDCLIKTKTPKFQQYWTVRTEEDEKRAIRKIRSVWEGIQKGVYIPNDTSWKCGYCAFKNHCDQWFQEEEVV